MTLQHYHKRILEVLAEQKYWAEKALVGNFAYIDRYFASVGYRQLDDTLAGLSTAAMDNYDFDLWARFSSYVEGTEKSLKERLESFKFNIEAENIYRMIAGLGRLEKVL
jgi:hypothetical protein